MIQPPVRQEASVDVVSTMTVPVELPRAILKPFIADQQARTEQGLQWRTLEQWLQDKILDTVMIEHQERVGKRQRRRTG